MTMLTTLAKIKRYANVAVGFTDDDDLLADIGEWVSEEIRQYCRQDFDLALYEETYDGSGNRWLQISQFPVHEIRSLSVIGQPVLESPDGVQPGYILDDRGLCNTIGYWPDIPGCIKISYVAGFEEVPQDIQMACAYVVALRYKKRQFLGLTSRGTGASTDSFDTADLPQWVKDALNKYVEPDFVLPSRSKKTSPPPVVTP